MKRTVIYILFLTQNLFAQNINGSAEYIEKMSENEFEKQVLSDPNMDPAMRKFIEEKMKDKLQKTFVLNFNKFQSEYKEADKVTIKEEASNGSWSPYGIDLELYKNIKLKKSVAKKDLMGKHFFVENKLQNFNWVLLNETKKIGNYNCNSAQIIIPVTKEEQEAFEQEVLENETNKTNFIKPEKPTDKIINVWYTVEIPISNGPEEYWGLPGLILEVSDGETIILCTKVVLNSKKTKIKMPKEKNLIQQSEYDKIVDNKLEELKNLN